jgi:DNA adenine methylase
MIQATFFDEEHGADRSVKATNVASVPQRSPFRYPGGKTWLIPRIRQWLSPIVRERYRISPIRPTEFIEPFAGGGIVGLTAAFEALADHVTMVELDEDVAAVWTTILDVRDSQWLIDKILAFEPTRGSVMDLLDTPPTSTSERAFQTIVKNRVYHGGIIAAGSGLLNYGENGKGIRSRWYPETLAKRILSISQIRDRLTFIRGDGLSIIENNAAREDVAFFLDPPYTVKGKGKRAGRRLYRHFDLDHGRLFALASSMRGDFLMTYDTADEVVSLSEMHHFEQLSVPMNNTHHALAYELLIGPNLSWAK